jgi:hypothetical protein
VGGDAQRVALAAHAVADGEVLRGGEPLLLERDARAVLAQPLDLTDGANQLHFAERQRVADLRAQRQAAGRRQVGARQRVRHAAVAQLERDHAAQLDRLVLARRDREHAEAEHVTVLLEQSRVAALHLREVVVDLCGAGALEHLADHLLVAVPVAEAVDHLARRQSQLAGELERLGMSVVEVIADARGGDLVVDRQLDRLVRLDERALRRGLALLIDGGALERERALGKQGQGHERRVEAEPGRTDRQHRAFLCGGHAARQSSRRASRAHGLAAARKPSAAPGAACGPGTRVHD